jgi:hypothetical protein
MDILTEAKQTGSAFLVTGAFNPYTRGHEEIARTAAAHAEKSGYSHFYHGLGASENAPDAPLSFRQKEQIIKGSHAHIKKGMGASRLSFGTVPQKSSISPMHQIVHLIERGGHKHITVGLGPDQMQGEKSLRAAIEKHMKTHGGMLGSDQKTVHRVKVDFHPLAAKRSEEDLPLEELSKLVVGGRIPVEHAKAGRLRKAILAGKDDLAHAFMPESILASGKQKQYASMIRRQFTSVVPAAEEARRLERNKKARERAAARKKKLTEQFSMDKISDFANMLNEAQIVQSVIKQRKTTLANKLHRAKKTSSMRGEHPLARKARIANVRFQVKTNFSRRLLSAKRAEIASGLDKQPRTTGRPRRVRISEELISEAVKRAVASPRKVRSSARTEVRSAGNPRKKDTIRKQEERREKKGGAYAVVVAREGKKNKIKIVSKRDIGKSRVLVSPDEFDKGKAKRYLDDPNFRITDSSKKLFPEFSRAKPKGAAKKKKAKETKKKAKKAAEKKPTVTKKDPRTILPELPKVPPKGKTRTTPKSQYEDWDHSSLDLEAAIPVVLNQVLGIKGTDPNLEKKMKEKLAGSKTLQASAMRCVQQIQQQFGDMVGVHMGSAKTKLTKQWTDSGGTDSTPKTDIMFVPRDLWKKANGDMSKIDPKKCIRASMKVGASRILNAEGGEAAATVESALRMAGDIAAKNPKVKSIVKKIKDALLNFAKSAETGTYEVGEIKSYISDGELPSGANEAEMRKYKRIVEQQDKLKDDVANMFREIFDISEEFQTSMILESFSGVGKFGANNAACATHLLGMNKDGTGVKVDVISEQLIRKILPDLKIRGAFKGRSRAVKGQKKKMRSFSTLFNIDYTPRLHEQMENSMFGVPMSSQMKNDLDEIGNDVNALMFYTELEPQIMVSNEVDVTDYMEGPSRGYNQIIIDGRKVFSIPVMDSQQFEETPQEINEDSYGFINDFLIENQDNEEGLNIALTSGLVSPETIMINGLEPDLASLLNEMWENSLLSPEAFESFVNEARNYRKEYDNYHSKPEQRKNRSKRVLARRKMMKKGRVKKGDGKDVDHKDGNPRNNGDSNLRVLSKSKNRSMNEEHGAGEIGTDELRKKYVKETPGMVDPIQEVLKGVVKNGIKQK